MYPNLSAELKRKNKRYEDIAKLLNIGIATVNEKMTGKSDFKLKEFKVLKSKWFPNCTLEYLSVTKDELTEEEKQE